jgi:hypothetical protein
VTEPGWRIFGPLEDSGLRPIQCLVCGSITVVPEAVLPRTSVGERGNWPCVFCDTRQELPSRPGFEC